MKKMPQGKTWNRIFAFLISFVLAASFAPFTKTLYAAWDGSTATAFDGGNGSRDNPYLISTPGQLALFRNRVNSGETSICARVTNDIDLGNNPWTPIGLTQDGYNGIFDGGGRAIKNLFLNNHSDKIGVREYTGTIRQLQVTGLFGVIGSGGTVKYVDVSGQISGSFSVSTPIYIGPLAGVNFGTIEECYSTCSITDMSITSNDYIGVGGIVGVSNANATVKNCFNTGAIDVSLNMTRSSSNNNYLGGIVGYALGDVYNCYSAAPINVSTNSNKLYLGGIAGVAVEYSLIRNSHFDRNVCTSASHAVGTDYRSNTPKNPEGCSAKDTADMKTTSFVTTMGNAFAFDNGNVNKGYPVLAVMTYGQISAASDWASEELNDEENQVIYERLFPVDLYNKNLTFPITRAEFAAVAVKLYEEMGGTVLSAATLNNPFRDTSNDAVIKAAAIGIVKGISDTEFNPYASISRQDMCTMLTRVYKSLNLEGWSLENDDDFALDYSDVRAFADDYKISDYAKPSVYFLVKNGIVSGISATEFAPRSTTPADEAIGYANASREQAAIVSIRMFKYLAK